MKQVVYVVPGMLFGVLLYKSEVISWFRIQEMFRFESIHMYGIIGLAVLIGVISVSLIKRFEVSAANGEVVDVPDKVFHHGNWVGGIIFGMGWALTGACPGPMFTHLGAGTSIIVVVILSALAGTWTYSYMRPKLPH